MSADPSVAQRLKELEARFGETVPVSEVAEVVHAIIGTLNGDLSGMNAHVGGELQELSSYIATAKAEIALLRPDEIRVTYLPTANDELDAIVLHTEAATNKILDAVERIEGLGSKLAGEQSTVIGDAVTEIYEACNFQDITGQRISKIVRTLKHIDEKVQALVAALGLEGEPSSPPASPLASGAAEISLPRADADLLNGPQLPDDAQKQAEIDALLASFD